MAKAYIEPIVFTACDRCVHTQICCKKATVIQHSLIYAMQDLGDSEEDWPLFVQFGCEEYHPNNLPKIDNS